MVMNAILLMISNETGSFSSYAAGSVIAAFILGYLLYSLIKPEKF